MKKTIVIKTESEVTLDGMMTVSKLENGLHTADFMCCEDARIEPFRGKCHVQMMRDGNVYVTELPKHPRNKALFREDNSSLSHGRDGRWYFCFSLDEDQLGMLPQKLVGQAMAIAKKVMVEMINQGGLGR